MAPIPRSNTVAAISAAIASTSHSKFVAFSLDERDEKACRPILEKLHSCDFSVEESSESFSDHPFWKEKSCGFPYTKTTKGRLDFNTVCLPILEKQKQDLQSSLKGEELGFKAFKRAITRSPTENDDLPSSLNKLVEQDASSCDEGLPAEGEREENRTPTVKKEKRYQKLVEQASNVCQIAPKKKSKPKSCGVFKRQSIGKSKRNVWVIHSSEANQQPAKTVKVKRKGRKRKNSKENGLKKSCQKTESPAMPSGYQCVDSGISSGSTNCSGTSNGQGGTYSDGSCAGGGGGGGGGGFCRKKGMGGNGRDEEENKTPLSAGDVNMEEEEEEEEEDDIKMSSKEGSDMDCHAGQGVVHSVPWEAFNLETQHLQHSSYCRKDSCQRPLCQEMKGEVIHLESHQCCGECLRCQKTLLLMKFHAATCKRDHCRVPSCNAMRNAVIEQPLPPQRPPPQIAQPTSPKDLDGLVYFDNTGLKLKSCPFQELQDYIKGKRIGKGGNGNVYKVHFPQSSPLSNVPMVVKETGYPIKRDEVRVYEKMDHPNIVRHYLVVMKGHKGQASVFMKECDKSLKDLLQERPLDSKEAIFYWGQIVDGVVYIHDKGIIHKDIKAMNVLLSELPGSGEGFRAEIADFDSAKILEVEFTDTGLAPKGTPGFISPEVLNKQPHGRPADVFSLGCTLMEMVGIYPNKDRLQNQVEELISRHRFIGSLVQRCVQQDYRNRPTAREIQDFLKEVPEELI